MSMRWVSAQYISTARNFSYKYHLHLVLGFVPPTVAHPVIIFDIAIYSKNLIQEARYSADQCLLKAVMKSLGRTFYICTTKNRRRHIFRQFCKEKVVELGGLPKSKNEFLRPINRSFELQFLLFMWMSEKSRFWHPSTALPRISDKLLDYTVGKQ